MRFNSLFTIGAIINMAINTIGHTVINKPSHCSKKICAKNGARDLLCIKMIMPEIIIAVLADIVVVSTSATAALIRLSNTLVTLSAKTHQ